MFTWGKVAAEPGWQEEQSVTYNTRYNAWDPLRILWAPPMASVTYPDLHSAAHTASRLGSGRFYPTAAGSWCSSQDTGIFCFIWPILPPIVPSGLSSWCLASFSSHDPFNLMTSTASETVWSQTLSMPYLSCCTRPLMPSKLIPLGWFFHYQLSYQRMVQLGHLQNTAF